MRRLILLRHAKTERDSSSGQDLDRRLDARGRADAPVIGQYLADHRLVPKLVLFSPARRTRETWDLLAVVLTPTPAVDFAEGLYGADVAQLLRIVRATSRRADAAGLTTIMVVGHNPGLHELSLALINKAAATDRDALEYNMPTSAAAVFKFAVDDWSDVSLRAGTLERFVSPRTLRAQGESS